MGCVHGLEHVFEELLEVFVKTGDGFRWLLQHRVAKFYDGYEIIFAVQ